MTKLWLTLLPTLVLAQGQEPDDIPRGALRPYRGAVVQTAPPELGNQELARLGLVDVTAAPFAADPTGRRDSTAALQAAIDFARDRQLVTFFPPGVYLVSDTLRCIQGRWSRSTGRLYSHRQWPCVLLGSRRGPTRPKLVLAPRSPGYGDPAKPKYVVHFWARALETQEPEVPQPNISFNQMFIGLDIALGEGNPGAVALRLRAAQGSGVEDCDIDVGDGLCGLEGGAGSGGHHANVTVRGGEIGLDLRETQPAPTISGMTLLGQRRAAILYAGRQSLSAVGCRIEPAPGAVGLLTEGSYAPNGQVCLSDSSIAYAAPGDETAIRAGRALYLHNVYIRHAAVAVAGPQGPLVPGRRDGWLRLTQFARPDLPGPARVQGQPQPVQYPAPIYRDGRRTMEPLVVTEPAEPPADLTDRHRWPADFPSWEDPAVVNVRQPPYNAAGDGEADDTAALQAALDAHRTVFLPKGYYRVSRPLRLRADNRLIGVARHLSIITGDDPAGGAFGDPAAPRPVVQTVDHPAATTILAFCGLEVPYEMVGGYALEWRAGRRSIIRDINLERRPYRAWNPPAGTPWGHNHPFAVVRGGGGGRWWGFFQESWRGMGADYRHLLIDGTSEPLAIYQCNPEHARAAANMELRGAANVALYGVKGEGNWPIVWLRDCRQVFLFGYGGNAAAYPGTAWFKLERCQDVLLANIVDSPRGEGQGSEDHFAGKGVDPALYRAIGDGEGGSEPLDRPVLYQVGQPVVGR